MYKVLGFGSVSQTSYLPLHLHLARVYVPGMAGDRKVFSTKEKSGLLMPKNEDGGVYPGDVVLNNGSVKYVSGEN